MDKGMKRLWMVFAAIFAFFFRGSRYSRFDVATSKVDAGYPKVITGNRSGWP
jgi:hypothetical protein